MPEPQQQKEKGSTEVALCEIPIPMPHFLSGQEARLVGIIPYKPLSVQIGGGFSILVAADQFAVEVMGSSDYVGHRWQDR